MKHIFSLLFSACCLLLTTYSNAQSPASFSYQGVLRDASGNFLASQNASLRFNLRSFSQFGLIVYQETQSVTTNQFGLFSVLIGTGTVISGDINTIDWAAGSMFLQVEVDPAGGTNYTDMGTTQLVSVPYSMHSLTSKNIELPFSDTINDAQDAFYVYNDGNGGALVGVVGTGDQMGNYVTAVKGIALPSFSNSAGIGVSGQINSWNGIGVKGYNQSGWGIWGETDYGTAIRAEANTGRALWAESTDGDAAYLYSQNGYPLITEGGWVGLGTTQPAASLHVWSDGNSWDLNSTTNYGDFYVGQNGYGLRVGVAVGGGGAGDTRIRSSHGTGKLILGAFQRDAITIDDEAIGVTIVNDFPLNTSEALRVQNTSILGGIGVRGIANQSGAGWGTGGYFEGYSTGVYGEGMGPYGNGVYGWSAQANGAALYGATNGSGAAALELNNGAMKVSGTNPTAFMVTQTVSNSACIIDSPHCNGDPNAIILITNRGLGIPCCTGYDFSCSLYYANGYWFIYDTDELFVPVGTEFNVLVIKK